MKKGKNDDNKRIDQNNEPYQLASVLNAFSLSQAVLDNKSLLAINKSLIDLLRSKSENPELLIAEITEIAHKHFILLDLGLWNNPHSFFYLVLSKFLIFPDLLTMLVVCRGWKKGLLRNFSICSQLTYDSIQTIEKLYFFILYCQQKNLQPQHLKIKIEFNSIENDDVPSFKIENLYSFKKLQSLVLELTPTYIDFFSPLASHLTQLTELVLVMQLKDISTNKYITCLLSQINTLIFLRVFTLDLSNDSDLYKIDLNLNLLNALKSIERLSLRNVSVTNDSLQGLLAFSQLKYIDVKNGCWIEEQFWPICLKMPKIVEVKSSVYNNDFLPLFLSLTLTAADVSIDMFASSFLFAIIEHRHLKKLSIKHKVFNPKHDCFNLNLPEEKESKLIEMSLHPIVNEVVLHVLTRFTQLRTLHIYAFCCKPGFESNFLAFRCLEILKIVMYSPLIESRENLTTFNGLLPVIGQLTQLIRLEMRNQPIKAVNLFHLTNLKKLVRLSLILETHLKEEHFKIFDQLTELRMLKIHIYRESFTIFPPIKNKSEEIKKFFSNSENDSKKQNKKQKQIKMR